MSFKHFSNEEIIQKMQKLIRTERKITHLILLYIIEIEDRRIHAQLGFDSMYTYLTRGLGYSEGSAYRRLQSARLLKEVPGAAKKIESGELNLTQLTHVQKCLNEKTKSGKAISLEKTAEILAKLENKNSFETQKTLSFEMDLPIMAEEKLKPQKDDSIRLEITLSKEQFKELEMAKSLLSHVCPEGTWSEVITTLAKGFNKKKLEGRIKSQPERQKTGTQSALATRAMDKSRVHYRKSISVPMKRALLEKAHHSCEYQDPISKKSCQSKYQLQIDHIIPKALGGNDHIGNLRVLCRTHNLLSAQKFGLRKPRT